MARFSTGLLFIDRNDNVQYVGKVISYKSKVQQVENVASPESCHPRNDIPDFRTPVSIIQNSSFNKFSLARNCDVYGTESTNNFN